MGTMGDNSETRRCEGGHTIWGDNGRQWEIRLREGGHTIQHRHTCGETMGENGEQWGTMGDQGRQDLVVCLPSLVSPLSASVSHCLLTRVPVLDGASAFPRSCLPMVYAQYAFVLNGVPAFSSEAHMRGDNGRQKWETTRWEGGPTIQHRHTCEETMGDNGLNGREGERRGDKILGRRTHHPTQAHMWGDNERQWAAMGDKTSGRRTQHPTQAHVGRQRETSGDKVPGRRTRQPTKRKHEGRHWVGDKGREDQGGHTTQQRETRRETRGDKTVRKAGIPSNKGKQEGVQWETPSERRHTIQQRETRRGTMGDKGRQDRRQVDHTIQEGETRRGTIGDKDRDQSLGKADTPSNKGKH